MSKAADDNRSNQLNPNNDAYYSSRGISKDGGDDEEEDEGNSKDVGWHPKYGWRLHNERVERERQARMERFEAQRRESELKAEEEKESRKRVNLAAEGMTAYYRAAAEAIRAKRLVLIAQAEGRDLIRAAEAAARAKTAGPEVAARDARLWADHAKGAIREGGGRLPSLDSNVYNNPRNYLRDFEHELADCLRASNDVLSHTMREALTLAGKDLCSALAALADQAERDEEQRDKIQEAEEAEGAKRHGDEQFRERVRNALGWDYHERDKELRATLAVLAEEAPEGFYRTRAQRELAKQPSPRDRFEEMLEYGRACRRWEYSIRLREGNQDELTGKACSRMMSKARATFTQIVKDAPEEHFRVRAQNELDEIDEARRRNSGRWA